MKVPKDKNLRRPELDSLGTQNPAKSWHSVCRIRSGMAILEIHKKLLKLMLLPIRSEEPYLRYIGYWSVDFLKGRKLK